MRELSADIVVVGGGNAGLCAAVTALEAGKTVLVLEAAPYGRHGGNSAFTSGRYRFAYEGLADLTKVVPDLSDEERTLFAESSYPQDRFLEDLGRITEYRCDPELANLVVRNSLETVLWLKAHGVRFVPAEPHQFVEGPPLVVSGGGTGVIEALSRACNSSGARILYGTRLRRVCLERGRVSGIEAEDEEGAVRVRTPAVILACGGFEANAEWRARYLGRAWELAKVRGSRYNTGGGLSAALEAGAMSFGNWSGCHAVAWDAHAPNFGSVEVGDIFQRHSYALGISVNREGERFFDEGYDFRTLTYATVGRRVLEQPGQVAWQIFDAKTKDLRRHQYRAKGITKVSATTLEGMTSRLQMDEGVKASALMATIKEYNEAVVDQSPLDPDIKDGRCTEGLSIPKSNWSNRIDHPPFDAYMVTTGITFTFGGVQIDEEARVVSLDGDTVPGLYASGEIVGGLFFGNYPGGSGLMAGSVLGRTAGSSAARQLM